MKLAIMQPYVFPYIGYFQLLNAVDTFVVYDDVHYIKKGWINRNTLLVNSRSHRFTIPLQRMSQNKLINELSICDSQKWKIDFLKTVQNAYHKAPYFDDVYPMLQRIINYEDLNLATYIQFSLQQLCDYLKIDTMIIRSSEITKDNDLKGESKILNICTQLHATDYINAIGGAELYDKKRFEDQTISLHFIRSEAIRYRQFTDEFVPWLSIIDVVMFNSVVETTELLNKFELV